MIKLANRQVKKTVTLKGKRIHGVQEFNYQTGEPYMDLYASIIRQCIRDLESVYSTPDQKTTARKFIKNSPYTDKILPFIKEGLLDE